MKISIIDKKDITISVENSTIKFDGQKLPFKLVDTLLISRNINIHSKDIIQLTDNKINIIFLNTFSNKSSIVHSTNPKNSDLKIKQYKGLEKRLPIAKYLIKEKIKRHIYQLSCSEIYLNLQPYLEQIEEAANIDILLGIEGSFAREYFKYYFTLISSKYHKNKRTKRPPLDPANALLSYFYFLIYNIITTKLLSFGFDPSISYLHTPFRDHNALSSDIMELFRDQINQFVVLILQEKIVSINDFQKKSGVYLNYEGKKKLHQPLKELWDGLDNKINVEIANLKSML